MMCLKNDLDVRLHISKFFYDAQNYCSLVLIFILYLLLVVLVVLITFLI